MGDSERCPNSKEELKKTLHHMIDSLENERTLRIISVLIEDRLEQEKSNIAN